MKKLLFLIFLLCSLNCRVKASDVIAEFKVGSYFPSSGTFREIFGSSIADYQGQISHPIWKKIRGWESLDYLASTGSSIGGGEKTHLRIISPALGLLYHKPFLLYPVTLSVGAGVKYFFVENKNESEFVREKFNHGACGGVIKSNITFFPIPCFAMQFFAEYSLCKINFTSRYDETQVQKVDLSGFMIGGGIGFSF